MPRIVELLPLAFLAITASAFAQTACTPQPELAPTPARQALHDHNVDQALDLAQKAALASEAPDVPEATFAFAHADYVRTLIDVGHHTHDALTTATVALTRYPHNAVLLDLVGEAHFRRGEISDALDAYDASLKADPCSGRIHYDIALYNHLNTQFLSESKQLNIAHQLAPHEKLIADAYERSQHTVVANADLIARMHKALDDKTLTMEKRAETEKYLKQMEAYSKGSCHVAQPTPQAVLKIEAAVAGTQFSRGGGAMVPMTLNGKPARPMLDTGASGLLISNSVAKAAGLVSEAEGSSSGIGNGKNLTESIAHVDSLRIGSVEFRDCLVRIAGDDRLHSDGLIGPDVFSSWVVTIDVPESQIRLSPLPPRPDESAESANLDTSGSANSAATLRNRYTPPEFKAWTPVYRDGHMLIFPTSINNGPQRLFLMDTGASDEGLISLTAAAESTALGDQTRIVSGVSGVVSKTQDAMDVTLTFGHIREKLTRVPAIDLSHLGNNLHTEISGLIGFTTLRELVIAIDYRDSLVDVTYDPKHGQHAR